MLLIDADAQEPAQPHLKLAGLRHQIEPEPAQRCCRLVHDLNL